MNRIRWINHKGIEAIQITLNTNLRVTILEEILFFMLIRKFYSFRFIFFYGLYNVAKLIDLDTIGTPMISTTFLTQGRITCTGWRQFLHKFMIDSQSRFPIRWDFDFITASFNVFACITQDKLWVSMRLVASLKTRRVYKTLPNIS